MKSLRFEVKGDWKKTVSFLQKMRRFSLKDLEKYGRMGVEALAAATPVRTGKTAASWYYKIIERDGEIELQWLNSNLGKEWAPIAILLQYGHATGNGGWVEGRDYINPALRPIFDKIAKEAWQEVTKS